MNTIFFSQNFEEMYGLVEIGAACFMSGFETRLLLLTNGLICVLARISTVQHI